MRVIAGEENLRPPTTMELRFGREGERMACQAVVTGECVVTTTYW